VIRRTLEPRLVALAGRFPVVTLTGPRQSGKTTLCRQAFPSKPYVSLEAPDIRAYAAGDPRGFLAAHAHGAILDEVQRVPDLLSYLQPEVDNDPTPGRFVLTGSASLALLQSVAQSLAGRTALVTLLPLGYDELQRFPSPSARPLHDALDRRLSGHLRPPAAPG
jgi:predicted AAA+ superfamily ATPase